MMEVTSFCKQNWIPLKSSINHQKSIQYFTHINYINTKNWKNKVLMAANAIIYNWIFLPIERYSLNQNMKSSIDKIRETGAEGKGARVFIVFTYKFQPEHMSYITIFIVRRKKLKEMFLIAYQFFPRERIIWDQSMDKFHEIILTGD